MCVVTGCKEVDTMRGRGGGQTYRRTHVAHVAHSVRLYLFAPMLNLSFRKVLNNNIAC